MCRRDPFTSRLWWRLVSMTAYVPETGQMQCVMFILMFLVMQTSLRQVDSKVVTPWPSYLRSAIWITIVQGFEELLTIAKNRQNSPTNCQPFAICIGDGLVLEDDLDMSHLERKLERNSQMVLALIRMRMDKPCLNDTRHQNIIRDLWITGKDGRITLLTKEFSTILLLQF